MKKEVIIIEPTIKEEPPKVGAYARVSSSNVNQVNSYHSQVKYYEDYIKNGRHAYFSGMYTDKGITGTSIEKRIGFQKMMSDAKHGKLDRIVTKSITRFGRNVTETLSALRELKAYGVSVYFEQEDIGTATVTGELKIAMNAFLAESESKTISQTAKWSFRKRAEKGYFNQPHLPYGYYRKDGVIMIDEHKARIIRLLFKLYIVKDLSIEKISKAFNRHHVGNRKWSRSGITWMLSNERYCGDMLLQKKYSPEVFPYKLTLNKGELPQYYVYDSFPKIIERDIYDRSVKKMKNNRKNLSELQLSKNKQYTFSSRIRCPNCGTFFKRRVSKGIVSWVCPTHLHHRQDCDNKAIYEEEIKEGFVRVVYKMKSNQFMLETYLENISQFTYDEENDDRLLEIDKQINALIKQKEKHHQSFGDDHVAFNEFIEKQETLTQKILTLNQERIDLNDLNVEKMEQQTTKKILNILTESIYYKEGFDEDLFNRLILSLQIDKRYIRFTLINNLELKMERKQYDGNFMY